MLDKIIESLVNGGPISAVLAFFMYLLYQMIQKLFTVIEANTAAWTNAHEKLDNMARKQEQRREDFKK